jgi:hypothetical protein
MYAEDTKVTPERTLSEIQSTLKRYGATKFALFDEGDRVAIGFEMRDRRCKMVLTLPKMDDYKHRDGTHPHTSSTAFRVGAGLQSEVSFTLVGHQSQTGRCCQRDRDV